MRRRELVLIAAVLTPFAMLVAAGFWFTAPHGTTPVADGPVDAGPRPTTAPVIVPARMQVNLPVVADAGATPAVESVAKALEAPLAAVRAEVRRCFADTHLPRGSPVSVEVSFRPLPDGGFAQVRIERDSAQDPSLDACLTDVFEELRYTPSGKEDFAHATHTFVFDPAAQEK